LPEKKKKKKEWEVSAKKKAKIIIYQKEKEGCFSQIPNKKEPKKGVPIINIYQVFEIQPLPTLRNFVRGRLSRGQFVGTKSFIIRAKLKINLNCLLWATPFN